MPRNGVVTKPAACCITQPQQVACHSVSMTKIRKHHLSASPDLWWYSAWPSKRSLPDAAAWPGDGSLAGQGCCIMLLHFYEASAHDWFS